MKTLCIHNVRLGLATNSSSSHSIIFVPNRASIADSDIKNEDGGEDEGPTTSQYGWDTFTLATDVSKLDYFTVALIQSLRRARLHEDMVRAVAGSLGSAKTPLDGYIDHESDPSLPRSWTGVGIDKQFAEDFRAFLLRDDVVVLGGHNNGSEGHHPLNHGGVRLPFVESYGDRVARKDEEGGYWTIFNREDGAKVRFSFDTLELQPRGMSPTKASAPELVDIKITDFCPYACPGCYQDSTVQGGHADLDALRHIADELARAKVFEVALGGGEPTMHPSFLGILKSFRDRGVVPNFTTRNLSWLRDPVMARQVLDVAGAFAVSVEKPEEVKQLAALLTVLGVSPKRAAVQYVVGSSYHLSQILREAAAEEIRVTLLGWKYTGRGASGPTVRSDYDRALWLRWVQEARNNHYHLTVAIDTALAKQFEPELKAANVLAKLYSTTEGAFSMYIDAVAMRAGPSSYCESLLMRPLPTYDYDEEEYGLVKMFQAMRPA